MTSQTTAKKTKSVREPLFHVVKRTNMDVKKKVLVYAIAIVSSLLLASILCAVIGGTNPFSVLASLLSGSFSTQRRIKVFIQQFSLLLLVSMAVVPAFRMKFWNLGANGQVLVSCLACAACMHFLGGVIPDIWVNLLMIVCSILAGVLWAVIPAVFKAFFNTNETLFTLMMNYIAEALTSYCLCVWTIDTDTNGVLNPMENAHLPMVVSQYFAVALVAVIVTVAVSVYLRYSKHGYEISVVGGSENTARYIGINVKKVVIRTLVLSGAVCGIVGLLLTGGINYTVTSTMHDGMGFTAIMTVWLAKFNPLFIVATSFFVALVTRGMTQVNIDCGFTDTSTANIVLGVIYFCIIACDFLINYRVVFRHKNKAKEATQC